MEGGHCDVLSMKLLLALLSNRLFRRRVQGEPGRWCVHLCVCVLVCWCVRVCICVCVCWCGGVCICVLCFVVCACACVSVCTHLWHKCLCLYLYMCMCMCLCMLVLVSTSMCDTCGCMNAWMHEFVLVCAHVNPWVCACATCPAIFIHRTQATGVQPNVKTTE